LTARVNQEFTRFPSGAGAAVAYDSSMKLFAKRFLNLGLLFLGLAAIVVHFGCQSTSRMKSKLLGQAAPAWQLKDLEGKPVSSADFKGKVLVLNFWATWCPPCRAEIPDFIALQKEYGSHGLTFVGVALDDEGVSVVKPFAKEAGINYPLVIGDEKVVRAYENVEMYPTTYLIDRNGNIVSRHIGSVTKAEMEQEIKPLLQ
jgi:DsbE subfamily thiol:disulfide oxidoreductase